MHPDTHALLSGNGSGSFDYCRTESIAEIRFVRSDGAERRLCVHPDLPANAPTAVASAAVPGFEGDIVLRTALPLDLGVKQREITRYGGADSAPPVLTNSARPILLIQSKLVLSAL